MNQLTVRGFEPELAQYIKFISEKEQLSLSQVALRLMRQGAGLQTNSIKPLKVGNALDDFIGCWSDKEAKQFDQKTSELRCIDNELWQ